MFSINKGNILKQEGLVEALVNPVNIYGVCGAGLAKKFKDKYPRNYEFYNQECRNRNVRIGEVLVFDMKTAWPRYIINFPTKKHWSEPSELEFIRLGLLDLKLKIKAYQLKSVAMPMIGCGLGGLSPNEVWCLIKQYLGDIQDRVCIAIVEKQWIP